VVADDPRIDRFASAPVYFRNQGRKVKADLTENSQIDRL
jgi:hypothetical protein